MMNKLEEQIKEIYQPFFEKHGIDSTTGRLKERNNIRFSGYPYIGRKYLESKKKILFYGLDLGSDELFVFKNNKRDTYHTFETRREQGRVLGRNGKVGAHHNVIGAIYRISLRLLKDDHNLDGYEMLDNFQDKTFEDALKIVGKELSDEVLHYAAFSNSYKFVTVGRDKKSGGKDRIDYDMEILKREIEVLNPNVVIVMGVGQNQLLHYLETKSNIVTKWMYHPSWWGKDSNKVYKSDKIANDILQDLRYNATI